MAFGDILGGLAPLLGSAYGPTGAAVGGIAGNMIQDYFKPEDPNKAQLSQLMQQMQNPYQFQQVDFNPIAQAEQRRFQQQTIPGIAERFTGMGGQRSSAFRQQLGGAAGDLASRLAELKAGHDVGQQQAGMQAYGMNQQRMGALGNLLQGNSQQQQAGRESQMNRYSQLAGMLPKTMLENRQQKQDFMSDRLKNMMLAAQQGQRGQQGQQDFARGIGQWLTGQNTDTVSGNIPSTLQSFLNMYLKGQGMGIDAAGKIIPLVV